MAILARSRETEASWAMRRMSETPSILATTFCSVMSHVGSTISGNFVLATGTCQPLTAGGLAWWGKSFMLMVFASSGMEF